MAAATELLESVLAGRYFELLEVGAREADGVVRRQEAALFGDTCQADTAELTELGGSRSTRWWPHSRSAGSIRAETARSRSVTFLRLAFRTWVRRKGEGGERRLGRGLNRCGRPRRGCARA
jgi:hypothetical protein